MESIEETAMSGYEKITHDSTFLSLMTRTYQVRD